MRVQAELMILYMSQLLDLRKNIQKHPFIKFKCFKS